MPVGETQVSRIFMQTIVELRKIIDQEIASDKFSDARRHLAELSAIALTEDESSFVVNSYCKAIRRGLFNHLLLEDILMICRDGQKYAKRVAAPASAKTIALNERVVIMLRFWGQGKMHAVNREWRSLEEFLNRNDGNLRIDNERLLIELDALRLVDEALVACSKAFNFQEAIAICKDLESKAAGSIYDAIGAYTSLQSSKTLWGQNQLRVLAILREVQSGLQGGSFRAENLVPCRDAFCRVGLIKRAGLIDHLLLHMKRLHGLFRRSGLHRIPPDNQQDWLRDILGNKVAPIRRAKSSDIDHPITYIDGELVERGDKRLSKLLAARKRDAGVWFSDVTNTLEIRIGEELIDVGSPAGLERPLLILILQNVGKVLSLSQVRRHLKHGDEVGKGATDQIFGRLYKATRGVLRQYVDAEKGMDRYIISSNLKSVLQLSAPES